MKNLDIKKLLVLIAIIAVIVLLVIFGSKLVGKESKPTEEESQEVETLVTKYYANVTFGYSTPYKGIDVLFSSDKTTYEDLDNKAILNLAIRYASDNEIDIAVSSEVVNTIINSGKYGDLSSYAAYKGEGLRTAIKDLYGVDFNDNTEISEYGYLYDFIYVKEYDTYFMGRNSINDIYDSNRGIDYTIVETNKKSDKVYMTIAIAYIYRNGNERSYAKDSNGEEIIAEGLTEFPKEKAKEFDNFKFTLTKNDDGKYIFESVEKVK